VPVWGEVDVKFGLRYCNTGRYVDPGRAVELVQAGEEAGFESAWTVEHTVVPEGYTSAYPYSPDGKMAGGVNDFPIPDPLIWMAYVGAATSKIRLATGILILPQHNPVITAKQVATLDYMTGGRVILGIGVGWLREEFEALGAPFAGRGRRTDEYVAALRELWSSPLPTMDGEWVRFAGAHCQPQPPGGSVPIVVGGHSAAAARRAGRLGDGFFPARGLPDELVPVMRAAAESAGRDPDAIEITVSLPDDLADLARLANLGVSRVLVPVTPMAGLPTAIAGPDEALGWRGTIEKYAEL
ncbi:MAG: LLM class F420-dependent oxidoreductase, partial [Thermoanaerobaculia bacterium]|nr:LLM class F420-dependent oxidoreductase [Thermoanaerobaculia bacterium]